MVWEVGRENTPRDRKVSPFQRSSLPSVPWADPSQLSVAANPVDLRDYKTLEKGKQIAHKVPHPSELHPPSPTQVAQPRPQVTPPSGGCGTK